MNEYEIIFNGHKEINFAPSNEHEEILQNVITIISTPKYSVPMFREFGIDGAMLDQPIVKSRAMFSSEVIQAVRKYEPRAEITHIETEVNTDGKLHARIKIRVKS